MGIIRTLAASVLALAAGSAAAQWTPPGPVRLVIPFGAGSATDVYARLVGKHLSEALGQQFVVEPKPGANGSIAAQQVARARPDGTTLFFTTNTTHAANPSLLKTMTYDPVKDFEPITKIGGIDFFVAVAANSPYKTVADIVAAAKASPGKVAYGSGNSVGIISGALLQKMTGTQMTHVPYKSTPQAIVDVVGGNVAFLLVDLSVSRPHVQGGRAKLLAVATLKRSPLAPEIPSLDELGYKGFDVPAWFGLFAPAGTPREVIARMNAEMVKVMARPDVRQQLASMGIDAFTSSPEELRDYVQSEIAKWARMVKDAGIQPE
ncbi:MAG: tripartite tricarboxylate transporter substrate binding protein [Betaproteobacteria bacterium]|nr:tripartite tricarboxylate transporter substrate binding protein [Betaproteobacteria bacterium]